MSTHPLPTSEALITSVSKLLRDEFTSALAKVAQRLPEGMSYEVLSIGQSEITLRLSYRPEPDGPSTLWRVAILAPSLELVKSPN